MFSVLRPFLFNLDPEAAHDLAIKSLKFNPLPRKMFEVEDEQMLNIELLGQNFPNPIGSGSGSGRAGGRGGCAEGEAEGVEGADDPSGDHRQRERRDRVRYPEDQAAHLRHEGERAPP